ncbi:MAG: flagellar hook-basal body complex protein, partial [Butyrivibrio sp.]|nr:flagellar hook-basal body complex protein [Butyrivibrio sp.]
ANVNTTSYKSQATGFQDVLYQTVKEGTGAGQNVASTNIAQVGFGSKVGSIYTNISAQGSAVTTNNVLDLMITGPSFFIVTPDGQTNNYSRDGAFTIDANGDLVTQNDGYYVRGVMGDGGIPTGAVNLTNLRVINRNTARSSFDANGNVIQQWYDVMPGSATTASYMKGNLDSADSSFAEGKDLSLEIYGTDGYRYTLKFRFDDNGDNETNTFGMSLVSVTPEDVWETNAAGETVKRELPDNLDMDRIELEYDKHNGRLLRLTSGETTINYTYEGGKMISSQDFYPTFTGDVPIGNLELDLMNTTNYASTMGNHNSTIYAYKGDTKGLRMGYASGDLTGISFGTDGSIFGRYSNGQTIKKGQIAVAEFANAMGLEKVGNNLYQASLNSGEARVQDITVDGGYMNSGVLEGSNIDLAKEFTDMITTQRGFQANSRVITTSDEMLQILKGLKR